MRPWGCGGGAGTGAPFRRYAAVGPGIWFPVSEDDDLASITPAIETDAEFGAAASMGTHLATAIGAADVPSALTAHRMRVFWSWVDAEVVEVVADSGVEARRYGYRRRAADRQRGGGVVPLGEPCS